jgi:hypothetical protein
MDFALRTVNCIPLKELWQTSGTAVGPRRRALKSDEITQLLRKGPIEFVVADIGQQLRWISLDDCYDFWKSEIKTHLAEANSPLILESFTGAYCYTASEWDNPESAIPIVLLERHH